MIKKLIHRWVMKHRGLVISWLVRTMVDEMQKSGMRFTQVNKWLRYIKHEPIKGYQTLDNGQRLVIFGKHPDQKRRKELGGRYTVVEV